MCGAYSESWNRTGSLSARSREKGPQHSVTLFAWGAWTNSEAAKRAAWTAAKRAANKEREGRTRTNKNFFKRSL